MTTVTNSTMIYDAVKQYITDNGISISTWQLICRHYSCPSIPLDTIRFFLSLYLHETDCFSDDDLRAVLKSYL